MEEDPDESLVRNLFLTLKGIVAGNPQRFHSEDFFFHWFREEGNAQELSLLIMRNWGWQSSSRSRMDDAVQKAVNRWNDSKWESQFGRHEYAHTQSACDLVQLPQDFAQRFEKLTRLCLWSFGELAELPMLPCSLRILDLRHARAIEALSTLPQSLETLDLTGCSKLSRLPRQALPNLRRLYLGRCVNLTQDEFDGFLESAGCVADLTELEVHGNPWLKRLRLPSRQMSLRVLRASDCAELWEMPQWREWPSLEHLDLRRSSELKELPELPIAKLQYLGLYGCSSIKRYLDQDLNERDLGLSPENNLADLFRLRTRLGDTTVKRPRCKLLFLGNGRGGKTTLSKALQWREMDDEARRNQPELRPHDKESVSHAIQQWNWHTHLEPLEGGASIRLWDFGGQETYHGTHRVFAASGALYVLVLRDGNPEPTDPNANPVERIPDTEWKEYNRQRPIEYWLDYILDLDRSHGSRNAARAKVHLVHTAKVGGERTSALNSLSDPHRQLIASEWFVGSLENEWKHSDFEGDFRTALKDSLHLQVREEGIRIPKLFGEVMDEIERRVRSVADVSSPNAILNWLGWRSLLDECAGRCGGIDLGETDAEAIARMFHQSGELFWMREPQKAVILHQRSALEEIYKLLDFRVDGFADFRKKVKNHFGLFDGRELRSEWWRDFTPALQDQLIDFMIACQICVRVHQSGTEGVIGEPLLALDPTLLPSFDSIETDLVGEFNSPLRDRGIGISEGIRWRLKPRDGQARPFSESDFRSLQAWAVNQLGERVKIWCRGLQVVDTDSESPCGFRLRWMGADENDDAYAGELRIDHWQDDASLGSMIHWLMGPGSPLPEDDWIKDDTKANVRALPGGRYDVGISVRKDQTTQANRLREALEAIGKKAFLYTETGEETITREYQSIRAARIPLLWVSDTYFEATGRNRYTMHEFANAIFAWARSQGLSLSDEALRQLPEENDQRVAIVFESSAERFDFYQELPGQCWSAIQAMVDFYYGEIQKADRDCDVTDASAHHAKFLAAREYAKAFADFWIDQTPISAELIQPTPGTDDEFDALARKIKDVLDRER